MLGTMSTVSSMVFFSWWTLVSLLLSMDTCAANHDARRLYDFLLAKGRYSKLVRPVAHNDQKVDVNLGLKLSQLIKVDEKNQIITMNMFLTQRWQDYGLMWDPKEYGGVETLNIPSQDIWLPDIVLYNNGDGNYNVTDLTPATLNYSGFVFWEPPVIIKSYCAISIQYFPFDEQCCHLKFGLWSYDYDVTDLNHIWARHYGAEDLVPIDVGIDTSDYYPNSEWDLMSVPAQKHIVHYPCCDVAYPDISFNFTLRRKTMHYAINLIMPTIVINLLTLLAFYLPSDCGEKISLCISILLSLSIFQLLLMDLIPPSSLTLPLMGEYLMCTLVFVTISVFLSVAILNGNSRSSSTYSMPGWVKRVFLEVLPPLLLMRRPKEDPETREGVGWLSGNHRTDLSVYGNPYKKKLRPVIHQDSGESSLGTYAMSSTFVGIDPTTMGRFCEACVQRNAASYSPSARRAIEGVFYIAKHLSEDDASRRARDDWRFLALVVDRLLLWSYICMSVVGGLTIMLKAPALYGQQIPINNSPSPV